MAELKYSFYPGCTLHSTGKEYGDSTRAACEALGIELHELEDWNCCGASSAHSLRQDFALALPGRNLMLAQAAGLEIAIPCAACYSRTAHSYEALKHDADLRQSLEQTTGLSYEGRARPRALLDIFTRDLDLGELGSRVRRPLRGLRPVSYYGCVLVRPPEITGWDDPEHPVLMDRLLTTLGAEPMDWSYSVDCCGASLSLTSQRKVVINLVAKLLDAAQEAGANCVVTACPLCQANLDTRHGRRSRTIPSFYFTELLGIALGVPNTDSWFRAHLVNPRPLLSSLGLTE